MSNFFSPKDRRPMSRRSFSILSATILAALPLAVPAQPTPAAPAAPRQAVPVITPKGGLPPAQPKVSAPPAPVPDSGANQAFSFQRGGEEDGSYIVQPADGTEGVRVSESFMGLVLRNPQINDQQRAQVLKSYPNIIQKQFDAAMTDMYPDASAAAEEPFQPQALGTAGGAGGSASLEPDPQAPGYVRISLATPDGQVQEFSAAQSTVERMLASESMTDEQKIQALKNFPFKLPETARQNFKDLSREELLDQVAQIPELQRQEFVKMRRYYPQATGDNATTPTEETGAEDLQTTIVERGAAPRPTVVATASEPEETPEPIAAEVHGGREGDIAPPADVPPPAEERMEAGGISTTAMIAIGVVALGLLAAAALAMRKGRQ